MRGGWGRKRGGWGSVRGGWVEGKGRVRGEAGVV